MGNKKTVRKSFLDSITAGDLAYHVLNRRVGRLQEAREAQALS